MLQTNLSLLGGVVLISISNLIVKARATHHGNDGLIAFVQNMILDIWMWLAVTATFTGLLLYVLTLRKVELSYAQPLLATVFVITPCAAFFFMGESMPPLRIAGLLAIATGVALVAASA